jgi:hypothetical protein
MGDSQARSLSGDASRGDERAVHLIRNTLHGAVGKAHKLGGAVDALAQHALGGRTRAVRAGFSPASLRRYATDHTANFALMRILVPPAEG